MTPNPHPTTAPSPGASERLPCPVCGERPVATGPTVAGSVGYRCDGNPPGSEPRHGAYVLARDVDAARDLWNKLAAPPASAPAAGEVETLHLRDHGKDGSAGRAACGFWTITNCIVDDSMNATCVECLRAALAADPAPQAALDAEVEAAINNLADASYAAGFADGEKWPSLPLNTKARRAEAIEAAIRATFQRAIAAAGARGRASSLAQHVGGGE